MLIATIATQRSGTKAFGSLFSTGTEVSTFGEVFNPDIAGPLSFRGFLQSEPYSSFLQLGADGTLDRFFSHFRIHRNIVHFDIMFNQLEFACVSWNPFLDPFAYGYLRSRNAVAILLTRRPADTFKSVLHLTQTRIAHSVASASIGDDPITEISASRDALAAYEDYVERQYRLVRDVFGTYAYFCEIDYEEFNRTQALPDRLIRTIAACAEFHSQSCDPARLQMSQPSLKRTSPTRLRLEPSTDNGSGPRASRKD